MQQEVIKMSNHVIDALDTALRSWNAMAGSGQENAEAAADSFEASFYRFIDTVREWVYGLEQPPQSMEELFDLPLIQTVLDRLPAPLYLNFETEAELMIDGIVRIDEDKYD
ncbi:hypothetical protein DQG23_01390 [Paenibacillus contaminans]|uniref:Uncharacterized protein n=2 Tax=Paenibacillus contaminans TaxID=450362 RepID=A0A329MTL9_9BACL|nr:hypothetical protein DQG23_01390 [Paenibacillus contaminans]